MAPGRPIKIPAVIPAGVGTAAIHPSDTGFQIMRQPLVVGIEECEQQAATLLDAAVACGAWTAILLRHQAQARIAVSRNDLGATVRGAIVHDNYFEVSKGLVGYRRQSTADVVGLVEEWDDDGNARHASPSKIAAD